MVPATCCRLMAALVAAFIFSSSGSLLAQGFPRGPRDALGPRYEAAPRQHPFPAHPQRSAIDFVRHWNEVAIDAVSIIHPPHSLNEGGFWVSSRSPHRTS